MAIVGNVFFSARGHERGSSVEENFQKIFAEKSQVIQQRLDDERVPLFALSLTEDFNNLRQARRRTVSAPGVHSVEAIGDRYDARR